MLRFWKGVFEGIEISRSHPYHKNDNRFVEQKNSTLVRFYLGYERLDSVAQVKAANQLYDRLWIYNNLFQPVMRLQEKIVVPTELGTRIRHRYDEASTPFDRLCATHNISRENRERLERLRDQANPRQLRQEIYDCIDHLFRLPHVSPGEYEDVTQTLFRPCDILREARTPRPRQAA